MMTAEELAALDEGALPARAETLDAGDIRGLVELLNEKDDVLRYHALLLLRHRSEKSGDVYPYIADFIGKLKSENSYQRNIGAILAAANAAWDGENRIDAALEDYLALLGDEKPITVRQCLQALVNIIRHKPALRASVTQRLLAFDLTRVKETMRKSILLDILGAMAELRKYGRNDEIEAYIQSALSGGTLDRKAIREVEGMLKLQ